MNSLSVFLKDNTISHTEIICYPDGQRNLKLDMNVFNPKRPVKLMCRIKTFAGLELLLMLNAALIKNDINIESIKYNYLMGMRSDRAFEIGMPNYFRDVIAPILNTVTATHFKYVLSPHSLSIAYYLTNVCETIQDYVFDDCVLIGGDKSVDVRHHYNNALNDGHSFYPCFTKERINNEVISFLTSEEIEKINSFTVTLPIVIVDDLCDGGATFIAASKVLKHFFPLREHHLFVTHGLFSKGVEHVAQHFDKIITTNSYQDFEPHPKLEVINVWNDDAN